MLANEVAAGANSSELVRLLVNSVRALSGVLCGTLVCKESLRFVERL